MAPEEKKLALLLSKAISGKIGVLGLREDLPKVSAKFGDAFSKRIIQQAHALDALKKMPLLSQIAALKNDLALLIAGFFPKLGHHKNIASLAVDNSIGFGILSPLLHVASLEEIMINGLKKAVFVIHRRYGMCKTNVVLPLLVPPVTITFMGSNPSPSTINHKKAAASLEIVSLVIKLMIDNGIL